MLLLSALLGSGCRPDFLEEEATIVHSFLPPLLLAWQQGLWLTYASGETISSFLQATHQSVRFTAQSNLPEYVASHANSGRVRNGPEMCSKVCSEMSPDVH